MDTRPIQLALPRAVGERPRQIAAARTSREGRRGIQGSRRARVTGYGGPWLDRASVCARVLRHPGGQTPPDLVRALVWLPYLIGLLWVTPRTKVGLTSAPSGEHIRAHLQLRRWGLPRFRLAQGVLHLSGDCAVYLRGRSKQAVRTNVTRARARGVRCVHAVVSGWTPPDHPSAPAAPAERWQAISAAGIPVGEAWVTVDDDCALLHCLAAVEPDVRWLLHVSIVERLCWSGCSQLITNSHDAFLMSAGQQYFQRRLGYSINHLRPCPSSPPRIARTRHVLALVALVASAFAVGGQVLTSVL
jgi:hypothetical protein